MSNQIQFKTLSQSQEDKRRKYPSKLENSVTSNNSKQLDKFLAVNDIQMF